MYMALEVTNNTDFLVTISHIKINLLIYDALYKIEKVKIHKFKR